MTSLKQRLVRRGAVIVGGMLAMTVAVVAPAQAAPIENTVSGTAFIWNCPVAAPGCFPGVQTRVGDVRVNEPLRDVCTYSSGNTQQNLVFNRTSRVGAAERTGFSTCRLLSTNCFVCVNEELRTFQRVPEVQMVQGSGVRGLSRGRGPRLRASGETIILCLERSVLRRAA